LIVKINATQEEFDEKRPELIRRIAGNKYDVILKAKVKPSLYDAGKPAIAERKGYLRAQNEMMDYFNKRFQATLNQIKKDIETILK